VKNSPEVNAAENQFSLEPQSVKSNSLSVTQPLRKKLIPSLVLKAVLLVALGLGAATAGGDTDNIAPAPEDFSPGATAVTRLLETGDAPAFAKTLAPSLAEWRAVASTYRNAAGEDSLPILFRAIAQSQRCRSLRFRGRSGQHARQRRRVLHSPTP